MAFKDLLCLTKDVNSVARECSFLASSGRGLWSSMTSSAHLCSKMAIRIWNLASIVASSAAAASVDRGGRGGADRVRERRLDTK